ncbi:MAG: 16S rRNA (guanine(527)-N(7))-methyltransferase RsmG [Phycisphaerae bacterium]|nr:16S rRNA (guanine(527)-N(7))-methyltransferase RsmG [Phycisphaerae bacterium]
MDTPDSAERGPMFDPSGPSEMDTLRPTSEFMAAIEALGIEFEERDVERLARYLGFLREANTKINLTAVIEPAAMWMRHILDSLTLVPLIASLEPESAAGKGPLRLLDVGSGAGLPGIPLAIVLPELRCTLLEATGKKVKFLEGVVAALGLTNVDVIAARAEDAGRDREHHRERYDVVTSRAVGLLPTLAELTVPFARVGGVVLAIKGERAAEEIVSAKAALYALHAHALEPVRTATGTIVVLEKQRSTPKLYPRRAGEPKRVPLMGRSVARDPLRGEPEA